MVSSSKLAVQYFIKWGQKERAHRIYGLFLKFFKEYSNYFVKVTDTLHPLIENKPSLFVLFSALGLLSTA
jgi:hypothetical protein